MIRFLRAGYYTSLQDEGRFGYRALGIPQAGPMDKKAFAMAQVLLPLENDCHAIECTYFGPKIQFEKELQFVITGAQGDFQLDGVNIVLNRVYNGKKGSCLDIGKMTKGIRCYIRFLAQLKVPETMGSVSFYFPITPPTFKNNEVIKGNPLGGSDKAMAHLRVDDRYLNQTVLEVKKGPDWGLLSKEQQYQILQAELSVIAHNRMGYKLAGGVENDFTSLESQMVIPGMVQLTPGGEFIVAMADGQVTGGYLQVLQLTEEAQSILAQKGETCALTFSYIPH